ncbi:MAG: AraC family transcriptional regulator [Spirochaetaceae bacterium]|jgi:AraC family transcriptional regulator|nr:AraC family transcriptional regulator [Spirochaetaceae bacterium]
MYREELLSQIKDYIAHHLNEEITLKKLSDSICYSEEHCSRLFKEMTGMKLFDYIRHYRLSMTARALRESEEKILNVALSAGFNSHEGFTRAFSSHFGISPKRFRKEKPEIAQFSPYRVRLIRGVNEEKEMSELVIFTQVIEKPARKLLLARGKKATEYFEYCEELDCDIWGRLLKVENALDEPMGMWMPHNMRPPGTSLYTQGVEVSQDYKGPIPEGLEVLELPGCKYMVFHSQPYSENMETLARVAEQMKKAMETYDPEIYGFKWAPEDAPRFQFIPLGERGYIEGLPVKLIEQ